MLRIIINSEGWLMHIPRLRRIRLASIVVCAALVGAPCFIAMPRAKLRRTSRLDETSESRRQSRITGVSITGSQPAGTFGGVVYRRIWGTVSGIVAPKDTLRGFDQLPLDADG